MKTFSMGAFMRKMNRIEKDRLLAEFGWATLCLVDPDGRPYAIEFSYFLDGEDICGLVHPRGRAAACLEKCNEVCVKICDSDPQCMNYRAVSCFGKAWFEKLTTPEKVAWAWDLLEKQLGLENGKYTMYKQRYLKSGRALPLLRVMVEERTGITNIPEYLSKNKEHAEPIGTVD
jgi:nitroimidazol reductase NimA-like FMN-containing flavoprotein (pyridoxamine 5'-phosphate oxidase superfamily)